MEKTGTIFHIQRFSTHDGPGIRTVVFFKGCPLRCAWCSNPESQKTDAELFWDQRRCIGCFRCQQVCPAKIPSGMQGKEILCTLCGQCVQNCPTKALEWMGTQITVPKLIEELKKDAAFYETSGGGVTLSGGEPLLQAEFVIELAKGIHREGYHVALETTGHGEWQKVEKVFSSVDLILYDIKHMDGDCHRIHTGVGNEKILDNARRAAEKGFPLIYRVPLLGGINANQKTVEALRDFALDTKVKEIHLLPYHTYGEHKYTLLRTEYQCAAYRPSEQEIRKLQEILEEAGLAVKIGG